MTKEEHLREALRRSRRSHRSTIAQARRWRNKSRSDEVWIGYLESDVSELSKRLDKLTIDGDEIRRQHRRDEDRLFRAYANVVLLAVIGLVEAFVIFKGG